MPEKPLSMKGRDVKEVRMMLQLTPHAFADVLGVHLSTLYRWEACKSVVMDPLHQRIFEAFTKWHSQASTSSLYALSNNIKSELLRHSALAALCELLTEIT